MEGFLGQPCMNGVRPSSSKNPVLGYVMKQRDPGRFSMLPLIDDGDARASGHGRSAVLTLS